MSDTSAYELRNRSCGAAFRKAWDIALEWKFDQVEHAAVERSVNGVPRPIFYKGEQVGEYRHYDERLTMFLLRSRRPHRYGKWIDQVPPQLPDPIDRTHGLADALLDISLKAPGKDGNLDDWYDEDEDDGDEAGAGDGGPGE
jgi:hypothetical protein